MSVSSPFIRPSLQVPGIDPPSPPIPPGAVPAVPVAPVPPLPPALATVCSVGILLRSILAASSQAPIARPAVSKATSCRVIPLSIPQVRRMSGLAAPPCLRQGPAMQPPFDPYAAQRALEEWAKAHNYTFNVSPDASWYTSWQPFIFVRFARLGRELRGTFDGVGVALIEAFEGDA